MGLKSVETAKIAVLLLTYVSRRNTDHLMSLCIVGSKNIQAETRINLTLSGQQDDALTP